MTKEENKRRKKEQRASARKYREMCNRLGLAFRSTQAEAYRKWASWADQDEPEENT